jgi:SWI/SNF-related matrix-associated actin-dependent regulator 1 of chromatin subfamily A
VELFPYQQQGACFLSYVQRGLLADEMGLGKSAQAIAATFEVNKAPRVAVVCPASLRQNWFREFERFWPGLVSYTLDVESYDMVGRGRLADWNGDVLILDEAHYLKTKDAKRTQAIFGEKCDGVGGLVERAKHVFLLTGTPIPNNPSELWPMLRAVMPDAIERPTKKGTIKPMAYWTFVERFCVTQDTGFGIKIIKGRNLAELKARIRPFVLRRKKGEVLKDLPPIRFDTLALDGAPIGDWKRVGLGTEDELKLIEKALADDGVAGLKAIAPHVAQLRRVTGMAKVPAAIEWIKEHFEGGGGKLVVFAHHTDVIEALDKALRDDVGTHVLHGGTPTHMRQAAVDAFQTNPDIRLFIGQIQAAGTGITLTAASDVLFVESSWVPAENEQAAMRVHRIGQKNACLIRFAMLAGSIDEQIQKAVMRKTQDIARLFS